MDRERVERALDNELSSKIVLKHQALHTSQREHTRAGDRATDCERLNAARLRVREKAVQVACNRDAWRREIDQIEVAIEIATPEPGQGIRDE